MSEENRMIVFNGKTWFCENVTTDDGTIRIRLYGENREFLREFDSAEDRKSVV